MLVIRRLINKLVQRRSWANNTGGGRGLRGQNRLCVLGNLICGGAKLEGGEVWFEPVLNIRR